MAVIETWFSQDLQKAVNVKHIDGNLFTHNGNGNRIGVRVYNDGEPVTLAGTVSGYVITSDGSTVPCVGARSGNKATITIPPAAYQPGSAFITIFLTDGSTVTTLCAAQTTVLQARTGSQVSPGSVVQDWTQTINAAMQSVENAAENLGGIIATPYASLTYPVPLGKYTYYNNGLYRCISPIASSEEFTAAHWTQVRLGDDVTDLKSAIGDIYEYVDMPYIHEEEVTSGSVHYFYFTSVIKNGSTFTIQNTGSSGSWTLNLLKSDRTEVQKGSVAAGSKITITESFDVYGIKSYLNSTQWNFTVEVERPNSFAEKTESAINNLLFNTCGYSEICERTVASDTSQKYEMNIPIKTGSIFRIINTSDTGGITINLVDKNGNENSKGSLSHGKAITITAPFDVYAISSYVFGTTNFYMLIEILGKQALENSETRTIVDSNKTALSAAGYKNVFRLSFNQTTVNGMTIKDITQYSVVLDGTATANTNFEIAFGTFSISQNMLMYMECPDNMTGNTNIWLQPGASNPGGAVVQPGTLVRPNVKTEVQFTEGYINSRCYLHINSGVTLSNTKIVFFASPSEPFDGTAVQENTFISDYNEENFTDAADSVNGIVLETSGNNEQFLFFTDPHLAVQSGGGAGMKAETIPYINRLEAIYNASPMTFCVCGGDWLGNGDVPTVAASKLTYIDGFMRKKFKRYYPINGNHDTNYQGKETPSSQTGTGRIDNDVLKMFTDKFRKENRMYYSFETKLSKWYIFDTGTESEAVELYQTQQLKWFAQSLLQNNDEHIIIALHILFPSAVGTTQPITEQILTIAEKYNLRESITIDGQAYSYAEKTGKVSFCIAGHMHSDWNGTVHDIPCILTANATNGNALTFDLCVADFTDKKLYMKRVGTGNDRTVTIL